MPSLEIIARQIGEWKVNVATFNDILPNCYLSQLSCLVSEWSQVFPKGSTWVGREFGIPSLLVRVDCVIDAEGHLQIYEVEDKPCGAGVTSEISPFFRDRFQELKGTWPEFSWVQQPGRHTDDSLLFGSALSLEEAQYSDSLLLVRSRIGAKEYHQFEERSISTVVHEGEKLYGVEMGLWVCGESVTSDPDWLDKPWVMKPAFGTRSLGIRFYLPQVDRSLSVLDEGLLIDRAKLQKKIKKESVFLQPFIPAMKVTGMDGWAKIHRFFFGWDCRLRRYSPLGGVSMMRSSLLVHGTNDSVTIPLVF